MQSNGFYAAMKTDYGVQALYIDEDTFRAQQEEAADKQRRCEEKRKQHKQAAAMFREKRATIEVLKQELKLIGMGAILYWGYCADLVDVAFAVPVLVAFQTLICFRAGRWFGRRERKSK
jgi:hypothetical protein